jgi:polyprenyl-phospho-N-acetylgalactosaminyl synthase
MIRSMVDRINSDTWIIMPCYNEEANLSIAIADVHRLTDNLIVVDDGSTDSSFDIACRNNSNNLKHVINLGKGAALKTGVEYAIGLGAKRVVFIDSDCQHEAKEIPRFLELLDSYDIVFGSRKLNTSMPVIFRLGNLFLNTFIFMLFKVKLMDTQSGYRAFRTSIYEAIKWRATDYSVESEIIANVGKNHIKYTEIEISTIYKNRHKGTTILDGIKIAWYMTIYRLQR